MKSHKKFILRMLEKRGNPMSTKQIRGALGLNKNATAKLKAELQKLVKAKKITKLSHQYLIVQDLKNKAKENTHNKTIKNKFSKNKINRQILKTATGNFTRNKKGFGFVNIGVGRPDVFIGENEQSFALEGDLVEIEFLRQRGFRGKNKGKIVRILKRASGEILARLKRTKRETLAIPIQCNSSLPFVRIAKKNDINKLKSGALILVELFEEDNNSKKKITPPSGKILKALEKTSDYELGIQLIINENLIRTKFPEEAKEYLKIHSQKVLFDSTSKRRDLRNLDFVTIDGKTAQDFDDAVCVLNDRESPKSFRLYVSIADVAHYVKPRDPVDKEAFLRGTSVYFPTHSISMLPEELSNNLCSLRPHVNRLTLTCEMRINANGEVNGYSIYESIIRSRARLIYDEVSDFLDGKTSSIRSPILQSNIRKMNKLAKILERKRARRGAVQFSFAEEFFEFDTNQHIIGVGRSYQSSAMKIIEQFMLEANETVAQHCVKNRILSIYRSHDRPDMKKLTKLQKTFHRYGIKTPTKALSDPKKFNEILEQIQDFPFFEQLQTLLLRSMALAVYSTNNKGHFGLAAKYYTHFTSPIRRYPDLLVHRALKEKIYIDQGLKRKRSIFINGGVAELCSQLERRSEKAERQSIELIKVNYLSPHIGQTFQAVISSIESHGFRVNIESRGIEWFLPVESIPDDSYVFDEIHLSLQSHRKKHILLAGKHLELTLLKADPIQRIMEFKVESVLK